MIEIVDWDPRQVPGLQGWFSARAVQTSGSEVLSMRNLVTGTDSMVALDATRRPTIETVNGRQWIRVSGSGGVSGAYQYVRSTESALISGLNSGVWIAATWWPQSLTGNNHIFLQTGILASPNTLAIIAPKNNANALSQLSMFDGTFDNYLYAAGDPDPPDLNAHLGEWWYIGGASLNREYDASGTVRTAAATTTTLSPGNYMQLFAGNTGGSFGANIRLMDLVVAPTRPTGKALEYIQNGMMKRAGLL